MHGKNLKYFPPSIEVAYETGDKEESNDKSDLKMYEYF